MPDGREVVRSGSSFSLPTDRAPHYEFHYYD